ncbi:phosphoribosylglycinamide formyltransferase [Rhizobium rhizosphaerae]|uniref:Phosphoribosylglycinamide formyltransferase n=1 Tax=Xaviernesmea rhizosphaerae TaxID=1672749 RepID=A0A1Q9AKP2_9HYPH|nr:phosphoribosylglycinamide formyltransferase [Xaviernesmea rhizosphaerae]OLP55887.1 phosphoribosylglycinamide formyltransferase [Xaviernesmea rhizosphaerae]
MTTTAAGDGARKRVVVMISGGGSNMLALVKAAGEPGFPAEIVGVISDKRDAGGLAKAAALGLPALALERRDYDSKAAHEAAVLEALAGFSPDLICLAGYMRLLSGAFIQRYEGRILNIHPSLLPLYPGLHTHSRAIEAGDAEAGCTVHFVTEGMDEGPAIVQARVPILPGDTPETLAARVLTEEHRVYAQALRDVAEGRVRMTAGT